MGPMEAKEEWIRVSRAASLLGCSTDTVRRRVEAGELRATSDPAILAGVAPRRGPRPQKLISLQDVVRLRSAEVANESLEVGQEDLVERVAVLEAEKAGLLAEIAKLREVARLSLIRDEHQAAADAVRREQLTQFLTPDFPND